MAWCQQIFTFNYYGRFPRLKQVRDAGGSPTVDRLGESVGACEFSAAETPRAHGGSARLGEANSMKLASVV
jgi:hypothetical protein